MGEGYRVGTIRIDYRTWHRLGDRIKQLLAKEGAIDNILPSLHDCKYTTSTDVIMMHPEMDPVESSGLPLNVYTCVFDENPDTGVIIRGPLVRQIAG